MDICDSHEAVMAKCANKEPGEKIVVPITSSLYDMYDSGENHKMSESFSECHTSLGFSRSGYTFTLNYETDDDNLVSITELSSSSAT